MLNSLLDYFKQYNSYSKYPDGVIILKEDGEVVYTNARFHEICALNESYNVVKNINELMPDFMDVVKEITIKANAIGNITYKLDKDTIQLDLTATYDSKNMTYIVQ